MSADPISELVAVINDRDAVKLLALMNQTDFIMIRVGDEDEEDGDGNLGALTADVEDFDVLVAFTTEENGSKFISTMGDIFEAGEEVEGFYVDGSTLLEYLPEEFGLLIDPESETTTIIDPSLINDVRKLQA